MTLQERIDKASSLSRTYRRYAQESCDRALGYRRLGMTSKAEAEDCNAKLHMDGSELQGAIAEALRDSQG